MLDTGLIAIVVALVGGVLVYLVRAKQDRPTVDVLKDRVDALEGARKDERERGDRLEQANVKLKATADTALEMALQKAKVDDLHILVLQSVEQTASEHRQLTTVLTALSSEHTQMMQESKTQSAVLGLIVDKLTSKKERRTA